MATILEMFNKQHKSCGFFSIEEIRIILADLYSYTKESFSKLINDTNTNFKDFLISELKAYIEQFPADEDDTYRTSQAEEEGYSIEVVMDLIGKIEELTNDDIKLMVEAIYSARKFFNTFLISDPLRELTKLRKKSNLYREGLYLQDKTLKEYETDIKELDLAIKPSSVQQ